MKASRIELIKFNFLSEIYDDNDRLLTERAENASEEK